MKVFRNFSFLSQKQIASYNQNGYLVLPKLIPQTEIAEIKRRAAEHIDSWLPENHPTFTTLRQESTSVTDYFLESGHKIHFFFEDSVKFPIKNKHNSINKIGHALHDLDNIFRKFSYRSEFRSILSDLQYKNPKIVQSMYIIKAPYIGGEVKAHQDCSYLITEPSSCLGFWVALEEATVGNACLFAVPGSHKSGTQVYWERTENQMSYSGTYQYQTTGAVCIEAKPGTVVVLHGDLVHWSEQNLSDRSRHAYTLHCVEGDFAWSERNWIQRPDYFQFRTWDS
jgi:phytanoyl-CoA hydroxylase